MLKERQKVDRRRIEDAFFQFALLKAASWYPHKFDHSQLPLHANSTYTIAKFTEQYHGAFMEQYSGKVQHDSIDFIFCDVL